MPAPVAPLDASLLDAKLSVPAPRPGAVSRAELIERARASGCRVVGVTAPAGYGKSTLLSRVGARPRIDRSRGCRSTASTTTPRRSSLLMASAYVAHLARRRRRWSPTWRGMGVVGAGTCRTPPRARRSRPSPGPFVLMLDDLHELQSPACHDVLGVVDRRASRAARSWSRRVGSSSPTSRGCGRRATRSSSGPSDLALDVSGRRQIFSQAQRRPHRRGGRRGDRADRGLAGRASTSRR